MLTQNLILFSNKRLNTPLLGVARSLMALATLATLIFNQSDVLFPVLNGLSNSANSNYEFFLKRISIFNILGYDLAIWISILILVIVFSGWKPRFTCVFHWWICFSLFTSSPSIDGGDQLLAVLTLLLIPICITDNRNNHWEQTKQNNEKPFRFQRFKFIRNSFYVIIRLQISYVYFQAAIDKLKVAEWRDGTVLYYWFNHPYFGLNDNLMWLNDFLFFNYVTTSFLTWSIIILELLLFMAFISDRRYRSTLFFLGVVFHLFTWLIHGLFTFFLTMTAALIIYLLPLDKKLDSPVQFLSNQLRFLSKHNFFNKYKLKSVEK